MNRAFGSQPCPLHSELHSAVPAVYQIGIDEILYRFQMRIRYHFYVTEKTWQVSIDFIAKMYL